MTDYRFDIVGFDKRFPDPGTDWEHMNYPVDNRFPAAKTDTRFQGGYGVLGAGLLTIGDALLSLGYDRSGGVGSVLPDEIDGVQIEQMMVGLADDFVLEFVGGAQIFGGAASVLKSFPDHDFSVAWNGSNNRYEATVPGLTAYFQARVGNTVSYRASN